MKTEITNTYNGEGPASPVCLQLTRPEADALLALLLRAPESATISTVQIERFLFRILKGLSS